MSLEKILLGIDVVDIRTIDSREAYDNDAFLKRVFTKTEQQFIKEDKNPFMRFWSIWACKEAAYKALSAYYPEIIFAWRKYQTDKNMSQIQFGIHKLRTSITQLGEKGLYALCFARVAVNGAVPCEIDIKNSRTWLKEIDLKTISKDDYNESNFIRDWAIAKISKYLFVEAQQLQFSNERGIAPKLFFSDVVLSHPVSLSHDGQFQVVSIYINRGI